MGRQVSSFGTDSVTNRTVTTSQNVLAGERIFANATAASFTLTYPSNGTIRITTTCGGDTNINLVWFGPRGY